MSRLLNRTTNPAALTISIIRALEATDRGRIFCHTLVRDALECARHDPTLDGRLDIEDQERAVDLVAERLEEGLDGILYTIDQAHDAHACSTGSPDADEPEYIAHWILATTVRNLDVRELATYAVRWFLEYHC